MDELGEAEGDGTEDPTSIAAIAPDFERLTRPGAVRRLEDVQDLATQVMRLVADGLPAARAAELRRMVELLHTTIVVKEGKGNSIQALLGQLNITVGADPQARLAVGDDDLTRTIEPDTLDVEAESKTSGGTRLPPRALGIAR